MTEFQFVLDRESYDSGSSGNTYNVEEFHSYRGLQLGLTWKKRNSEYICAAPRAVVPSVYDKVSISWSVYALHRDGKQRFSIRSGQRNVYDDGRHEGSGPFGLDSHNLRLDSFANNCFFNKNGREQAILILQINGMQPEYSKRDMLKEIYEEYFPADKPREPTEVDKLVQEIDTLNSEFKRLQAEQQESERALQNKKKTLSTIQEKVAKIKQHIEQLTDENHKFQGSIKELKSRIEKLEKELENCNLNETVTKFDPDKMNLDDFELDGLRALLTKLLDLQVMVADQLLKEDICSLCQAETKSICSLSACGHVSCCDGCIKEKKDKKTNCPVCTQPIDLSQKVVF